MGQKYMSPVEYQKLAVRTECHQYASRHRMIGITGALPTINMPNESSLLVPIRVNHSIIGLCGEVGEICELFADEASKPDEAQLILEFGDLLWYTAEGLNALGFDMTEIVETRIEPIGTVFSPRVYIRELATAVGGLASLLQKWIYYGKFAADGQDTARLEKFKEAYRKLMGAAWLSMELLGLNPYVVMDANITKLRARYPDKYSDHHAADENRDKKKEESHVLTGTSKLEPLANSELGERFLNAAVAEGGQPISAGARKCQYCNDTSTCDVKWFKGPPGKPGPVTVPWCGQCSLKEALAKRGMTAPVSEGQDYEIVRGEVKIKDDDGQPD